MRIILSKILKINKCLFLIMFDHDYGTCICTNNPAGSLHTLPASTVKSYSFYNSIFALFHLYFKVHEKHGQTSLSMPPIC